MLFSSCMFDIFLSELSGAMNYLPAHSKFDKCAQQYNLSSHRIRIQREHEDLEASDAKIKARKERELREG